MNMTKLVCVFLSLLLAVYSTESVDPPIPPQFVYRADFRGPLLIFQNGMQSWGTCENVYYHVDGESIKNKTSAFISTTSSERAAKKFARDLLINNPEKATIYIYKIRANQTFYNAYYSLMFAAHKIEQQGNNKTADAYEKLAEVYEWQKEWMAYREIPSTLIKEVKSYSRKLISKKSQTGTLESNPYYVDYVDDNMVGNDQPFPESKKGC